LTGAAFTLACDEAAHFDSRVWLGPSSQHVIDYFRWRQADATRCALNGWCYWTLRKEGNSVREATRALDRMPVSAKDELLFARGTNFNDLPAWQRRGTGLYWEEYEKSGFDPIRNETVTALRRRVRVDGELPMKEAYDLFIADRIAAG
jgi:tRNA(His) guanylyltransferase